MVKKFLAFGKHVVKNLLNSPFFEFEKAIISNENKHEKEVFALLKEKKITVNILNEKEFSRISPERSQGFVVIIKKYKYSSLKDLLDKKPFNKYSFFLILDSIEDPHNFGSIIRTAAALNIDGIIITENNQVPVNSTVVKVSAGGIAYIPICVVSSLSSIVIQLKKRGFEIISTVCNKKADFYYNITINSNFCLIFGNENKGIRPKLIENSDRSIYIPVLNSMNSLSVSVSCGIISSHFISILKKEKKL